MRAESNFRFRCYRIPSVQGVEARAASRYGCGQSGSSVRLTKTALGASEHLRRCLETAA